MKPIVIKKKKGNFGIFLHHEMAVNSSYMYYQLKHFYEPFLGPEHKKCQNQDLWRLECLYDYRLDSENNLKPYTDYELVNGGEWECAMRIPDTYDFHGGLHGSERFTVFEAMADGKVIDEESGEIYAETASFYQKSDIYLQLTDDTVIAEHEKWYEFSKDGLTIRQSIKWLASEIIDYAYLTMLPIKRHSENGDVITDKARLNGETTVYDVSTIGHTEASKRRKNVREAEIWSDISGIYAKVTVLRGQLDTNDFFIQNNPTYNKLYFSFVGDGGKHRTEVGEVWNTESHYDIYRFIDYK